MSVRIGKVDLIGIQEIYTEETRNLVEQRVPDQQGSVFQDLGREPVTLVLEGLLFGPEALPDLEKLRQAQEKAEPLPMAADIAAGTELTEVIIEDLRVRQVAGYASRYRFFMRLREHMEPPRSQAQNDAPVNQAVAADAETWAADSTAACAALEEPAGLADTLMENPELLNHMSADDLADAVADNADKLSAEDLGGTLKIVGTLDPHKMEGMLTGLKEKGALGGFMEKFTAVGKNLKEMLKGVDLIGVAKNVVTLFTVGVELIRHLNQIGDNIKDVLGKLNAVSSLKGLEGFLKTGIENLKKLVEAVAKLVQAVDNVVKTLKPKQESEESSTHIAKELNCGKTLNTIIQFVVDGLRNVKTAVVWIADQILDLGGLSGLWGVIVPVLDRGPGFAELLYGQFKSMGIEEVKKALDSHIIKGTDAFQKVLDEGKSSLETIWNVAEATAELDMPICTLRDHLGELGRDIASFAPNKQ